MVALVYIYALSFPSSPLSCSIDSVEPDRVVFLISNPSAAAYTIQVFVQTLQGNGWQPEQRVHPYCTDLSLSFSLEEVPKPPGAVKWRAVFHCERRRSRFESRVLGFAILLGCRPSWFEHKLVSEAIQ